MDISGDHDSANSPHPGRGLDSDYVGREAAILDRIARAGLSKKRAIEEI